MAGKKIEKEEIKPEEKPVAKKTTEKDPAIAAVLAFVAGLILCAPGVGYIYLGKVKKGIIYIVICWIFGIIGYIGASICCVPIIFPLIVILLVTYDVYLDAKGEKTILPDLVTE